MKYSYSEQKITLAKSIIPKKSVLIRFFNMMMNIDLKIFYDIRACRKRWSFRDGA